MDNLALSLVIGIASSLIATAVFISLSEFVRRVALPWYADKIYRGVRIDGKWTLVELKGHEVLEKDETMNFELFQKGDFITGTYYHKDERGESTLYDLTGHLRDMFFSATAVPKSNKQVDAISYLLHVNYMRSKLRLTGSILCTGKPGEIEAHNDLEFALRDS